MHRPIARLAVLSAALLIAVACGDETKDDGGDDTTSNLMVRDVELTTAEDTPVAGGAPFSGQLGTIRASVETQGAHGTIELTGGTTFTYTPEADYAGSDTAVITVRDDQKVANVTVTITVTPVNDAPRITGSVTASVAEDSSVVLTAANLGVTDVDDPQSSVIISVITSNAYLHAGNELRPLPNYNGNLTVSFSASDGESSVTLQAIVPVTAVNDAPVVTVPGPQQTEANTPFTYDGAAQITVADRDAGSAPIAITLGASAGNVTLSTTTGLTFSEGDGTNDSLVRFSGTQNDINAALAGLVVTPPSGGDILITLTLTADDQGASGAGGALSDTETFSLGVGAVDLPPFNTIPGDVSVNEDDSVQFQGARVISVADANAAGGATVSVALAVTHGVLTLNGTTGLSFALGDGNADVAITFSGTFANVNAALNGLRYTPAASYAGADTLTMTSTSGGLVDTDGCAIAVDAVNDAPVITGPSSSIDIVAETTVTFTAPNAIALGDLDAGTSPVKLTATATAGEFGFVSAPSFTADTSVTHVATMTGTLAQFAADLAKLQWNPGTFSGAATLTFVVDDQGATGSGGARTDTLVVTVNIDASLATQADSYKAQGNVRRIVPAPGVLANDSGVGRSVTTTTTTSTLGGTVTMTANGGFTYVPPRNVGAREQDGGLDDTFTYSITGASGGSASGTVTINLRRVIWFVDKDHATSGQDGTFSKPYDTIAKAVTAAEDSHFGVWIYVYNSATPYTADVTLPHGTSLFGSRIDFDLQDADEGDPESPTTLPGIGSPTVVAGGATAFHLGENSKISGFKINPGAVTTGPAIEGMELNSGVIDNVVIDNFATGIALTDTSADRLEINNVQIKHATDAITLTTDESSGLSIISCLFQNVTRGLTIDASAGAGNNGRLGLFVVDTDIVTVSGHGIKVQVGTGANAVFSSEIFIGSSEVTNGTSSPIGQRGIEVDAIAGALDMQLDDVDVRNMQSGFDVAITDAVVNMGLNDVDLLSTHAGTFQESGYRFTGGTGGRLDLTVSGLNANTPDVTAFDMANGQTTFCADLSTSNVRGVNDLSLTQAGAPFALDAYNGTDALETYLNTAPRSYLGSVQATGTFTGATCLPPPSF